MLKKLLDITILKNKVKKFGILLFYFLPYFLLPVIFVFTIQVFNFENEVFYSSDSSFMAFHAFTLTQDFSRNFLESSKSVGYPDRYFFTYDSSITSSFFFTFLNNLSKNLIFSYNFQVVFFIALAGLGGFLFARKTIKSSIVVAFFTGLFYSYNSITLHLYWAVSLLSAYSLIPFFYLYYLNIVNKQEQSTRIWYKDKNIFLAIFFCFLLGISSLQIWFFSLTVSGLVFLIWSIPSPLKTLIQYFRRPFLIYVATLFLLSPVLAYQTFFSQRYVLTRNIEDLFTNSIHISSNNLKQLFSPYCGSYAYTFLTEHTINYECNSGERFWLGSLPLVISLVFLLTFKKREIAHHWRNIVIQRIVLTLTAIFSISLGPLLQIGEKLLPLPYYWLYRFLPAFDAVRVPARFIFFFQLFYALFLALVLKKISTKLKKFVFIFYVLVFLLFIVENSYSYQEIGYKKITSLDENVWQELSKPQYGLFLKYPIPWFGGEGQGNPDDTQELWEYMIHHQPTIWSYPGFVSHSTSRLMGHFLGNFLTENKIKDLSALGVKNIVIDKTHLQEPISIPLDLTLLYEDNRYKILQIPDYKGEKIPFSNLNPTCAMENQEIDLSTYNKNWNVFVTLSNSNSDPMTQTKPQILVDYQINGQITKHTAWLQLPFLIPAEESSDALLVIRKGFLSNLPITQLNIHSLDPDISLDFSCTITH